MEDLQSQLQAAQAEIARLKAGRFTPEELQNLCHTFSDADLCDFYEGCHLYQRQLFGKSERDVLGFVRDGKQLVPAPMPLPLPDVEPIPAPAPATIEAAVERLLAGLDETSKDIIRRPDSTPHTVHHFAGRSMRNSWGLWEFETPIKRDAVEKYKIAHADDLSGLIMAWVWAKVRDEAFDPLSHVEVYHEHWGSPAKSLEAGGYQPDGTPAPGWDD